MKWSEVIAHKELSNLPFKVELNEWGNIVMSPASNRHGYIQTQLVLELNQQKQSGTVFTECSVETSKGVKVADVVWGSSVFFLENGLDTPYQVAPEVCIEIRSPSNTRNEMQEKKDLYLAKGAEEVWVCDEDGLMVFYNARGEIQRSNQFPEFPTTLALDFPPA
ncbi:MAG: Uma2 family endonuclease [Gemmatimonadota bacterium]|nr:Uma2 family endonuclease [Gemmatimonadota bacterium]